MSPVTHSEQRALDMGADAAPGRSRRREASRISISRACTAHPFTALVSRYLTVPLYFPFLVLTTFVSGQTPEHRRAGSLTCVCFWCWPLTRCCQYDRSGYRMMTMLTPGSID